MTRTVGRLLASMVLLFAGPIAGKGTCADTRDADRLSRRIERDVRRFRFAGADNVMALLAIGPGMTILDIGTGTGQFAYEFARRLNGTGAVYATDTQAYCVDFVKKEAERRGLGNLHPVLVGREGLDGFYGKHRYDLIAIFHVAMAYDRQVGSLRQLGGYLADGGRLALIVQKLPAPFSMADFQGDFRGLVDALAREPAGSPYSGMLKDATRTSIRAGEAGEPPEALKRAIVEDFNEALRSGPRFLDRFPKRSAIMEEAGLLPEERVFADFLLVSFGNGDPVRSNLFKPDPGRRDAAESGTTEKLDAMLLNKLIIVQRFRPFLKPDGLFLSGFTPPIRAAFERAGYKVQRVYAGVIPFEDLVIFSAR